MIERSFPSLVHAVFGAAFSISAAFACVGDAAAQQAQAAEAHADPAHGRAVYQVCRPCHEIGRGARHRSGPHLNGLFGRRAGVIEGYPSTPGMVFAGLRGAVWDAESLAAFLSNPKGFAPGSAMPLIGVPDLEDRRDLIAFLRAASKPGTLLYEHPLEGPALSRAASE